MKIFLSWSGARSKAVATLLRDWIRCVLQAARPWISTRDLDRGSLWFSEINEQLKDTTVGIICLTQENKERPWILFEAGALTKGLTSSRVCPLLIDLQTKDVADPLGQFNLTLPDENGIFSLVATLNGCAGPAALEQPILENVFETYWPQFKDGFDKVVADTPAAATATPRNDSEILADILANTRELSSRVMRLESTSSSTARAVRRKWFRDESGLVRRSTTEWEIVVKGDDESRAKFANVVSTLLPPNSEIIDGSRHGICIVKMGGVTEQFASAIAETASDLGLVASCRSCD